MSVETELAWSAGFFDGEGNTCTFLTNVYKENRSYYRVQAQISQHVSPETLFRFQAAVGGLGRVYGPYRYRDPKTSTDDYWKYQAGGPSAFAVLDLLWPYLCSMKTDQAHDAFVRMEQCRIREYRPPKSLSEVAR